MEKATFSLPCPSRNGDEYAPSFEGYYDPSQRWSVDEEDDELGTVYLMEGN